MTSVRPAVPADMAAVATFHERTPPRVADTAVAVAEGGPEDDEVEQVFAGRDGRGGSTTGRAGSTGTTWRTR